MLNVECRQLFPWAVRCSKSAVVYCYMGYSTFKLSSLFQRSLNPIRMWGPYVTKAHTQVGAVGTRLRSPGISLVEEEGRNVRLSV